MADFDFDGAASVFEQFAATLAQTTDRNARQKEIDAKLIDYAPGGKWQYAPDSAKESARATVEAEQDQRAGIALFHAEQSVYRLSDHLTAAIERSTEAPTPDQAWTARTRKAGLSASEYLDLHVLDELRTARITQELDGMLPSAVLAIYDRAIEDPTEQCNASTIRLIERRFGAGWQGNGRDLGDDDNGQLEAANTLHKRIRATRDTRIPPSARLARQREDALRRVIQYSKDVHQVRPVRPA
jgi:hypothetical protein